MLPIKLILRNIATETVKTEKKSVSFVVVVLFFPVYFQNLQYSDADNVSLKGKKIPTSPKCICPQKLLEEPSPELLFLSFCGDIFHKQSYRGNGARELGRGESRERESKNKYSKTGVTNPNAYKSCRIR